MIVIKMKFTVILVKKSLDYLDGHTLTLGEVVLDGNENL